jgi:uncharacterized protein
VLAIGNGAGESYVRLLDDRTAQEGRPTAYVCRGYTCDAPVTDPLELASQLENAARMSTTV